MSQQHRLLRQPANVRAELLQRRIRRRAQRQECEGVGRQVAGYLTLSHPQPLRDYPRRCRR